MTAYLVDTNVISELVRPRPEPGVIGFFASEGDLWLSGITLHELSFGAEREKQSARKSRLITWIENVRSQFAGRILDIDDAQAMTGGRLRALATSKGRSGDPLDALIAAGAASRGLTIVTRNTRDFEGLGVIIYNPWTDKDGS